MYAYRVTGCGHVNVCVYVYLHMVPGGCRTKLLRCVWRGNAKASKRLMSSTCPCRQIIWHNSLSVAIHMFLRLEALLFSQGTDSPNRSVPAKVTQVFPTYVQIWLCTEGFFFCFWYFPMPFLGVKMIDSDWDLLAEKTTTKTTTTTATVVVADWTGNWIRGVVLSSCCYRFYLTIFLCFPIRETPWNFYTS